MRHCWTLLTLLLLLFAAACSGGGGLQPDTLPPLAAGPDVPGQTPIQAGPGLDFLPALADLDRLASDVPEWERLKGGHSYEKQLPNMNVDSNGYFNSNWSTPADGLANAAYAIYRFGFSQDYTGEARIKLIWYAEPVDPDQIYLALANYEQGRWQWFQLENNEINLGEAAPYLSSKGQLATCVLQLGVQQNPLLYVVLGDNLTPNVTLYDDLDSDKTKNIGPRQVVFDASSSSGYGTDIVSFDFDFDGDGSYDVEGNTDGTVIHQYQPGNYDMRLRITDSAGKQALLDREIIIIDPLNQAPLAVINSNISSGPAPLPVMLDALGSSDPDGFIELYMFDFDNDGQFDYSSNSPQAIEHVFSAYLSTTVTLKVIDNFFAESTDTLQINCTSGWVYGTVDSSVNIYTTGSMAICTVGVEERAAVVYVDADDDELRYSQATTPAGTSWGPVAKPLGNLGMEVEPYSRADLAYSTVNAAPMVACAVATSGADTILELVRATDQAGSSWSNPIIVPGISKAGNSVRLEVINTLPALYTINDPTSPTDAKLMYIQAQDPLGAAWSSPVTVETTPGVFGFNAIDMMQTSNGFLNYPLISYVRWNATDGRYDIFLRRSSNVDGTAWEAADFVGQQYPYTTSLTMVAGKPALAAGNSTNNGICHYTQAADAKGQSWPDPVVEVGLGGSASLAEWGGVPVICAEADGAGGLLLYRAVDAQASAWQAALSVDSRLGAGGYCNMLVVNDVPVITYFNSETRDLLSASWKN